ncbi:hypothetical protein N9Y41_02475, partial [Planktomarina temperata]|nr:hypothetical protein [Planktomarina temperata]
RPLIFTQIAATWSQFPQEGVANVMAKIGRIDHSLQAFSGIFHLRKIDPERRDLFFNEVST